MRLLKTLYSIWRQHGRSEKSGEMLWDSKSISAWIQGMKGMLRWPTIPFIPFIQAKKSFVALFALDIRGPHITLTYPLGRHQFAEYP